MVFGVNLSVLAVRGPSADPTAVTTTLEELRSLREERPVAAIDLAVIHVGLGETEAALDWIERGYEERNWQVRFLGTEPAFDPLRSEARFRAVLEDVGVPPT